MNLEEARLIIQKLKGLRNEDSIQSYSHIKNIINSMQIPLPLRQIPKGSRWCRIRLHKDEEFFTKCSQLSYRTDILNIHDFGRANEPGQGLFYCANDQRLAFIETSFVARNQKPLPKEVITTSAWEVVEDLIVINILNNPSNEGKHAWIDQMSEDFYALLDKQNDDNAEIVRSFLHLFSEEFAIKAINDTNIYKISCAFTNYIIENVHSVDGIIYPSSLLNTEHINMVVNPQSVDNKIKLIGVRKGIMERYKDTFNYYENNVQDAKNINIDKNEISW